MAFAYIWGIVIFILSVLPGRDLPNIKIDYFDKFAHAIVYAFLSFLILRAMSKPSRNALFLWVFMLPVVYGILIECFQGFFLNERIADVYDMLANAFGSLIVVLISAFLKRIDT